MIINSITDFIGNTPLLLIRPEVHGLKNIDLYAKLELFNPFGSLKDRTTLGLLEKDLPKIIADGRTIIESSSGNTAKAMAAFAGIHGLKFKTITNRIKIPEVKGILQILGAEVVETPGLSECPDPDDDSGPLSAIASLISVSPGGYYQNSQYFSDANPEKHFATTGQEIAADLQTVDYLVASVGTSGSSRGVARCLMAKNEKLVKVGVIAEKGDFIPGIRNADELKEVGIFDPNYYDVFKAVDSQQAIDAMLTLNRRLGVLAGPTSGATYFGALDYLRTEDKKIKDGERKTAVFIVCDRVEWYLSYIQKRRPDIFKLDSGILADSVSAAETEAAPLLTVDDLSSWRSSPDALIVDIRGSAGFSLSHLPDSVNIGEPELDNMLQYGIPFSRRHKLLIVCAIGERSKKIAARLNKRGVYASSLEGGIMACKRRGISLESW